MNSGRTIRLTLAQLRYLADASYLSGDLRHQLASDFAAHQAPASFKITESLAEQFRSEFTERLAEVGFDEAYELTDEGRLLEDLLDVFMG